MKLAEMSRTLQVVLVFALVGACVVSGKFLNRV
jgi:hypothetical protein